MGSVTKQVPAALASRLRSWQSRIVVAPDPSPSGPSAGGALIALGAMGGAATGFAFGEATPGFLIGTGLGIAASLAIWWQGRRR